MTESEDEEDEVMELEEVIGRFQKLIFGRTLILDR